MTNYYYEALDSTGLKNEGTIEVSNQIEAVRRIKEMGLFPTRIAEQRKACRANNTAAAQLRRAHAFTIYIPFLTGRVKPATVAVFTRQLATLVDAGMPLLRGLRILHQQESNRGLKNIIANICQTIETGGLLSEALAAHPRVFNPLYINMVKAGELGGSLEITLRRLAEFIEKAQKIKGKVKSAMFYPVAVMIVAAGIMAVLMVFVIPRFREIFDGLMGGAGLPAFTQFIFQLSAVIKNHFLFVLAAVVCAVIAFAALLKTDFGRRSFDLFKLHMPILGNVFRKASISRFARTLGTLLGNGVPVLQALAIVKETVGNVVVGRVVSSIHDSVKEGETMTAPLRASSVFPPVIVGMVDVGEQTGALPDMLMKVADTCDEEVDNAVNGLTSLLEPVLIVFLAIVVGSIVIAMFLPLISIVNGGVGGADGDN